MAKRIHNLIMLAVFITMIIPMATRCAVGRLAEPDEPPTETGDRAGEPDELITEADAIAVVEILSTDYTATASDGPMYAEAKVLKVLKGNISTWRKLRFGETGWWSPTYKEGERRIVFLSRVTSKDYYESEWHTTHTGSVDFFFVEDSLESISQVSLSDFLKEIRDASNTPPKIEFSVTQKDATTRMLSIKVINDSNQAFWLNPSRIAASLDANQIRYSCEINWANYKENTWIKIEPTSSISGLIYLKAEELGEANEITVMLSHLSACFPYRCWTGFESANVSLED